MSRPRIICHMHTLLNGKIDGIANITSVGMRSQKLYFDLSLGEDRFYKKPRGWLSGTATSRASLGERELELPAPAAPVPAGDRLAGPDAKADYLRAHPSDRS